MTATVVAPTLDSVLKRADAQYARRSGDDPASPEYLAVLAKAARPLLEQGAPAEPGVDLEELTRLREESAARGRLLEERGDKGDKALREKLVAAAADIERLNARVTELLRDGDGARADGERLADEVAELKQLLAREAERLAAVTRDLSAANRTLDEIADEERAQPAAAPHRHRYPLDETSGKPLPCECKQLHPHDPAAYEVEDVEPDAEPLAALLSRIGAELTEAGWQW